MSRRDDVDCKVYVGDLPKDAGEREIERAFSYYGHIKKVWVAKNPPGFAFVEFEDPRDADDAIRGLDGTTICGNRARVEKSTGKIRPKPWMRGGDRGGGGGRGFNPDDRCYKCGERGHYAYDCRERGGGGGGRYGGGGGRRRSRSRSYDRYRGGRSRSRSRSPRRRRSRSHSPRRSRSRSRSPYRRSHTRSPVRRSRSRSRSAGENGH